MSHNPTLMYRSYDQMKKIDHKFCYLHSRINLYFYLFSIETEGYRQHSQDDKKYILSLRIPEEIKKHCKISRKITLLVFNIPPPIELFFCHFLMRILRKSPNCSQPLEWVQLWDPQLMYIVRLKVIGRRMRWGSTWYSDFVTKHS